MLYHITDNMANLCKKVKDWLSYPLYAITYGQKSVLSVIWGPQSVNGGSGREGKGMSMREVGKGVGAALQGDSERRTNCEGDKGQD